MGLKLVFKFWLYRVFLKHRRLREFLSAIRSLLHPEESPSTGHLYCFDQKGSGPIQLDEAHFLFGLCRVTRPRVIVEFGFNRGHSAMNFALACPDAHVFSYDIGEFPALLAKRCFSVLPNFTFVPKSQADFDPGDIGNQKIDLAFIDASHVLSLNQETFRRIHPYVAEDGLIVVHDTGLLCRDQLLPEIRKWAGQRPDDWLTDSLFQHQKEERLFVNWVAGQYPEYAVHHLSTLRTPRLGLTLFQGRRLLPTEPMV